MTPRSETRPRVGLIVETPESAEGMRSDPAVSVPVAAGHHAGGQRRRRTAARAAGGALERPRVADLIGRPAHGELVGVEVAEQDHAPRAQACPDIAVGLRPLLEQAARRGQGPAGDGVQVLQPDGDAPERRQRVRALPIGARSRLQSRLLVHAHPRIDRYRIALVRVRPVSLSDARQAGAHELGGRQPAVRDQRGGLCDGQVGGVHDG